MKKLFSLLLLCLSLVLILGAVKLTPNHHPVNKEGLIGWWAYRNTGSVSALGTWKDYSGNVNNGTSVGDAFVDNQGINLDGTGDSVDCGAPSVLANPVKLTISVWVKLTAVTNDAYFVSYGSTASGGYHLGMLSNKYLFLLAGGGGTLLYSTDAPVLDTWTNIVVTLNHSTGTDKIMYINGEFDVSSGGVYKALPSTNFFIGQRGQGTNFINGIIADVQIYNRILSAGEIKANYLKNKRN